MNILTKIKERYEAKVRMRQERNGPATEEQIRQLELDYKRELLRTEIAKQKADRPRSGFHKFITKQISAGPARTGKAEEKRHAREEQQKQKEKEAYIKKVRDGLKI